MYLLVKSYQILKEIKRVKTERSELYQKEHPTYCVLAVYILRTLQAAQSIGLLVMWMRFVFILMGYHYTNLILFREYWLYYLYQLLAQVVPFSMEFMYISQICEWMAMLYILKYQKQRKIEEILYDQNLFDSQARRNEKVMAIIFRVYFLCKLSFAAFLMITMTSCTHLVALPMVYGLITLGFSVVNLTLKTVVFFVLMWVMKNNGGHLVYKKTKYKLCIFFCVDFLSYLISIVIYTFERSNSDIFNNMVVRHLILFCYLANIPQILSGYAILYLKSQDDLLMELSKLDWLAIQSIFSRRKKLPKDFLKSRERVDHLRNFYEMLKR